MLVRNLPFFAFGPSVVDRMEGDPRHLVWSISINKNHSGPVYNYNPFGWYCVSPSRLPLKTKEKMQFDQNDKTASLVPKRS